MKGCFFKLHLIAQHVLLLLKIFCLLRCPNPKDGTVQMLQNGISTTSRFSFRMFVFNVDPSKIFLHCNIQLCLLKNNNCALVRVKNIYFESVWKRHLMAQCFFTPACLIYLSQHCHSGSQRRSRSLDFHDSASISIGPLIRFDENIGESVKVSKASELFVSLTILVLSLFIVQVLSK